MFGNVSGTIRVTSQNSTQMMMRNSNYRENLSHILSFIGMQGPIPSKNRLTEVPLYICFNRHYRKKLAFTNVDIKSQQIYM